MKEKVAFQTNKPVTVALAQTRGEPVPNGAGFDSRRSLPSTSRQRPLLTPLLRLLARM